MSGDKRRVQGVEMKVDYKASLGIVEAYKVQHSTSSGPTSIC
jgi:hypothetical protein